MSIVQYLKIINLAIDKSPFLCIIAVYKQLTKSTRLSGRSIFKIDGQTFSVYKITTIYRNYLLLGEYSHKVNARYKIPTSFEVTI